MVSNWLGRSRINELAEVICSCFLCTHMLKGLNLTVETYYAAEKHLQYPDFLEQSTDRSMAYWAGELVL